MNNHRNRVYVFLEDIAVYVTILVGVVYLLSN